MKKISLKDIKNSLKRDEMRAIIGGGCGNGSGTCVYSQYYSCNGSSTTPCWDSSINACSTCCLS